MPSENVSRRVNQQERLKMQGWICGFVDGEGCFSVSIFKNKTTKLGYQTMPEFVVTQGEKSLNSLKKIKTFFKCGNIFVNRRYDNHKENIYRYCVRNFKDLQEKIIPFFVDNPLKTAKQKDFIRFKKAISLMERKVHLKNPQRLYANLQKWR